MKFTLMYGNKINKETVSLWFKTKSTTGTSMQIKYLINLKVIK